MQLHPDFKERFRGWWQECQEVGWEGHRLIRKLQLIKAKLKVWNRDVFGDLKEEKNNILSNISRIDSAEQEGNLTHDLYLLRALRKRELEILLLKEEIHLRQKSRVKWIREGDCSSKFFHRLANGRQRRKLINS